MLKNKKWQIPTDSVCWIKFWFVYVEEKQYQQDDFFSVCITCTLQSKQAVKSHNNSGT